MTTSAETQDAMALADRNRAIAIRLMEALDKADVDTIRSILSPDVDWYVSGVGTLDLETLITQLQGMLGMAKVAQTAIVATTAEGERVAVESRGNFEFDDGRIYRNHYHHLFVVRDDRVVGVREYLDLRETERVFGPMEAVS
ncbi:nuclear transport factor 2 family protein [Novosphingobium sp. CCH12-A3]|uniref:nuclear transport factor 2 family protein n=1 Tax=Novosphingobium sp. CCH12-A3 TaxID=1768752 RepID=UPI000782B8B6|nr:nuclear transport factor 2 family protein [Novosphingobium sp. CCH12-A3]